MAGLCKEQAADHQRLHCAKKTPPRQQLATPLNFLTYSPNDSASVALLKAWDRRSWIRALRREAISATAMAAVAALHRRLLRVTRLSSASRQTPRSLSTAQVFSGVPTAAAAAGDSHASWSGAVTAAAAVATALSACASSDSEPPPSLAGPMKFASDPAVISQGATGPPAEQRSTHRSAPCHPCPTALDAIAEVVGPQHVNTDAEDCADAGKADWSFHSGPAPYAVVTPASTQQVAAVLAIANSARIPVVPSGGRTGLEGHTTAPYRGERVISSSPCTPGWVTAAPPSGTGIVLSTRGMDKVLDYNPANMDVVVQPGITWEELNAALAEHGVFFPVDPGPGATIGGMVNTGCSGTNAVRYGAMKHHVLNVTLALPDGSVMRTAARAKKTSAGFDLTSLVTGSEGTLGVVTEVTLKLTPTPAATAVAVVPFPSIRSACEAVQDIVRAGVPLNCVELLDEWMVRAVNAASGFDYPATPMLFFKFAGPAETLAGQAAAARKVWEAHGAGDMLWEASPEGVAELWRARKVALWSAPVLQSTHDPVTKRPREAGGPPGEDPGDMEVWITDVCVPLAKLPSVLADIKAASDASPLHAPIVGHVGDGNVHSFLLMRKGNAEDRAAGEKLAHYMADVAIAAGGTCTGEHGIGVGKREQLRAELGPVALSAMARIKAALDPHHIMNPGKVLPDDVVLGGVEAE